MQVVTTGNDSASPAVNKRDAGREVWRGLAVDGRIVGDYPCLDCGYNLRSQLIDHCCPECGEPVRPPAAGTVLRFADPQWLKRISDGAGYVAVGAITIVASLTALGVFTLASTTIASIGGRAVLLSRAADQLVVVLAVTALGISGLALIAIAYGLLTMFTPRPRAQSRVRWWNGAQQTIAISGTLVIVPLLLAPGLWALGGASSIAAVAVLAMLVLVWLHLLLVVRRVRSLEQRCTGFDRHRQRALNTYRAAVNVLLGAPVMLICTVAVAAYAVPLSPSLDVLPMVGSGAFLPWLLVMLLTVRTRRVLQRECKAQAASAEAGSVAL